MTAIMKGVKINRSSILLSTLKNMVQHTKQSFNFAFQLSKMLEDSVIPLYTASSLQRSQMLKAQSVISSRPKRQTLTISTAGLLAVKKDIREEITRVKKGSKETKRIFSLCSDLSSILHD